MNRYLKNWKTTSAGIVTILGGVLTIVYAVKEGKVTAELITGAVSAILGGVGLIFASDAMGPSEPSEPAQ